MVGIQALGASSGPTTNCCFHRGIEPFASEVGRVSDATLAVDTFKLYKQAVSKFDAFREQYNFNESWLPNIEHIVIYYLLTSYSFSLAKHTSLVFPFLPYK